MSPVKVLVRFARWSRRKYDTYTLMTTIPLVTRPESVRNFQNSPLDQCHATVTLDGTACMTVPRELDVSRPQVFMPGPIKLVKQYGLKFTGSPIQSPPR
jgi:hypothetical protein